MRLQARRTFILLAVAFGLAVSPGALQAQGGGQGDCGHWDWCYKGCWATIGEGWSSEGGWGSASTWCVMGSGCDSCTADPLVSANTVDAALVIEMVSSVPVSELAVALTDEYRRRLVLHPSRNLVAVVGTCNPQEFSAVAFLPSAKVRALDELGIRHLRAFLAGLEPDGS